MGVRILSAASAVPEKVLTNEELSGIVDTSDEWITTRTGVRSRYICTSETLTDLGEKACKLALERAGVDISQIGIIIASTISGDYVTPSLSCSVSERLGGTCPAFDINAACAGFIYTLDVASSLLETDRARYILMICAEMMSKHVDWSDRSTCVLFGDAAAACVLERGNAIRHVELQAVPNTKMIHLPFSRKNSIWDTRPHLPQTLHMEGGDVYRFAVNTVCEQVGRACAALGITPGDIDLYLLHQANRRIVDAARLKLGLEPEKFPLNMEKYGNVSSATIPILIGDLIGRGVLKEGMKIFMSAFGAGMVAAGCVMVWEEKEKHQ